MAEPWEIDLAIDTWLMRFLVGGCFEFLSRHPGARADAVRVFLIEYAHASDGFL